MSMKLKWAKDDLIHESDNGFYWNCGVCGMGSTAKDYIRHAKSCPFSDPTVGFLIFSVGPEHDSEICGRCDFTHENCPVFSVLGGWDLVTHERLSTICPEYGKQAILVRAGRKS